jgi:hypothetical protein
MPDPRGFKCLPISPKNQTVRRRPHAAGSGTLYPRFPETCPLDVTRLCGDALRSRPFSNVIEHNTRILPRFCRSLASFCNFLHRIHIRLFDNLLRHGWPGTLHRFPLRFFCRRPGGLADGAWSPLLLHFPRRQGARRDEMDFWRTFPKHHMEIMGRRRPVNVTFWSSMENLEARKRKTRPEPHRRKRKWNEVTGDRGENHEHVSDTTLERKSAEPRLALSWGLRGLFQRLKPRS